MNWFSVASPRSREAKCIRILLVKETSLTLSKAIQYLKIHVYKYKQDSNFVLYWQHICSVWWMSVSTDDWYSNGYNLCSASHRFAMRQISFQGFLRIKIKKNQTFDSSFRYIDDGHWTNLDSALSASHFSKWAWSKGYCYELAWHNACPATITY